MARRLDAGYLQVSEARAKAPAVLRISLCIAWLITAIGYHGAWIGHETAALSLSGVDMGEFVKFLPGVAGELVRVWRQLFYLPVAAVVLSVALLVCSRWLGIGRGTRSLAVVSALLYSLQLLPPAWSPASLKAEEFRFQVVTLGVLWLALAGCWLWSRMPGWLAAPASGALALGAAVSAAWQLSVVEPLVEAVYSADLAVGWGFILCQLGLILLAVASIMLGWRCWHRRMRG